MSANLVSPPHHQVGENCDPQDGANKRDDKIFPGCLENTKLVHMKCLRKTATEHYNLWDTLNTAAEWSFIHGIHLFTTWHVQGRNVEELNITIVGIAVTAPIIN